MAVEVDRDALLAAVQSVQDVVAGRTTIPVLANLLIEADGGRLTVTGTDLDLQASASCEAAGSLSITVDRTKFAAAIGSFKPGRLSIAMDGAQMKLSLARGRRTLATLPAQDFPKRDEPTGAVKFTIPAASLMRLFDTCHVAQSTDETRYYLNGIFLHASDGKLVAVASDGHRLVRAHVPAPDGTQKLADAIVPTKAVTLLRKLLAKREGDVALAMTQKTIEARFGAVRVDAKLVEGSFPDYTRIIPPDLMGSGRRLIGARDAFIEPAVAVGAVVAAEGDKVKTRAIAIEATAESCEVQARDNLGASANEPMDVELAGDAIRVGVNQKYLVQIAGLFAESGKLTIELADPAAPMRVTGDKDPDLLAVIMPMRV